MDDGAGEALLHGVRADEAEGAVAEHGGGGVEGWVEQLVGLLLFDARARGKLGFDPPPARVGPFPNRLEHHRGPIPEARHACPRKRQTGAADGGENLPHGVISVRMDDRIDALAQPRNVLPRVPVGVGDDLQEAAVERDGPAHVERLHLDLRAGVLCQELAAVLHVVLSVWWWRWWEKVWGVGGAEWGSKRRKRGACSR